MIVLGPLAIVLVADLLLGGAAGSPKLVPDGLRARKIVNEEKFVAGVARERNWDASPDSLESYWKVEAQASDSRLGRFLVARLSNPQLPGGAQERELWFVYRGPRARWIYGPLITQMPPTSAYNQRITTNELSIVSAGAGKLIWVELQDKLVESLEGGARTKATQKTHGYAFRVSEGGLGCVAFKIPLKTIVGVDDAIEREAAVKVTFPDPATMSVERATSIVEPEQEAWLGKHALPKR